MNKIFRELKHHAPFTAFGAVTGILFMVVFRNMPHEVEHGLFYVFHPLHVVLSAIVTTAIYKLHRGESVKGVRGILPLILVGYFGSIGIATLSDSIIPFTGEKLLGLPHAHMHAGFIEEWYIVNPAAFAGIFMGYFWPRTKFPHAGHVLISTWASLFHVMMAMGGVASFATYFWIFVFLSLSVWLPCCFSDIIFPLLFVKRKEQLI
ncbi:MAG: hypothetical protein GF392_04705 [Candidatus Omnitrophica bacterium]|nr:hypothetical protein [Candidatus Omnitrophota bacterium]